MEGYPDKVDAKEDLTDEHTEPEIIAQPGNDNNAPVPKKGRGRPSTGGPKPRINKTGRVNTKKKVIVAKPYTRYPDAENLSHKDLVDLVMTDPGWTEARRTLENTPKTTRQILCSGQMRRACANDTCAQAPIGDVPLCWSCMLKLFGFVFSTTKLHNIEYKVRCILVHGGIYEYTPTIYTTNKAFIVYICPFHGNRDQEASGHMKGNGCGDCSKSASKTREQWIEAFAKKHGDTYIYDKTITQGCYVRVCITCRKHGDFRQLPGSHMQGKGCIQCGFERMAAFHTKDMQHFLEKASLAHTPGRYLYYKSHYIKAGEKVTIVCGRCESEFLQTPDNHYQGKGCPNCRESKLEALASRVFKDLGLVCETQTTFEGCVGTCRLLRFDAVVCDKKILIELDGLQHFQTSTNWNGDAGYQKRLKHDNIKDAWCRANNKILVRISHVDIKNMKMIIETAVKHAHREPAEANGGGYILATRFYTTFKDRDTSKYTIIN